MEKAVGKHDLEITIESALLLAEPNTAVPVLAERIYASEPDLMKRLQREWMVQRLTWMLYRRKQKIKPDNQLFLPGFEKLPRRLTMRDGTRPRLPGATLPQLVQYRRHLAKRRDPRLKQLDALIGLMKRHAPRSTTLTVAEVMAAEQAKFEAK